MLQASEDVISEGGDFEDPLVIATCPECRCPYTEEKICGFRTEYLAGRGNRIPDQRAASSPPDQAVASNVTEPTTHSGTEASNNQPVIRVGGGANQLAGSDSEANTRAAVKIHLEEQVSEVFIQGLDNVDSLHIVELNSQVQDWLSIEQAEGRIKEHTLLRSSMDLLVASCHF
ncbi:hypothetical protein FRC12_024630 [Ceratobasidium sp. 428]|nr:hypothetical protein FRC12_024630 [Ceratobasidium sp. 428]